MAALLQSEWPRHPLLRQLTLTQADGSWYFEVPPGEAWATAMDSVGIQRRRDGRLAARVAPFVNTDWFVSSSNSLPLVEARDVRFGQFDDVNRYYRRSSGGFGTYLAETMDERGRFYHWNSWQAWGEISASSFAEIRDEAAAAGAWRELAREKLEWEDSEVVPYASVRPKGVGREELSPST